MPDRLAGRRAASPLQAERLGEDQREETACEAPARAVGGVPAAQRLACSAQQSS